MRAVIPVFFLAFLVACQSDPDPSPSADAGTPDAAIAVDAGPEDAGEEDAGPAAPYSIEAFQDTRITSLGGEPNFQQVEVPIDFADGPFSEAKMFVELRSTCFPWAQWTSNPPPPGHNWPASCDAFDRNFELLLDPRQSPGDPPPLELARIITPFGGPMNLEFDVTDIANGLGGSHLLRAHISTWPDPQGIVSGAEGGWNVSVRFEMTPGPAPRDVLAVIPVADLNHLVDNATTTFELDVPEGVVESRLEYRATGHGGGPVIAPCIGPAEEFCPRTHDIFIDGRREAIVEAWRTDCDQLCTLVNNSGPGPATYCQENPCGAVRSVQAPRANWCPGSVTPPFSFDFDPLRQAGRHSVRFRILDMVQGGSWRISLTYIAYGDAP